ncbi:Na(+)/H(+) antiporter NhaA 3 [Cnuibacter physcomitrellae]|uniref:Na(+)/H(+) antiporter NhaA n=1 Tax=Cnuibacter physcomitrellae TaxID=1619308 RepID=A0A1X9LND6_9MICO|nr:Na+/H+ antiporter NhaA [Cnuibacter physcomitrellae]ARJ05798.1 Na+/H+ antiporter NhaA [Cnuibacter physcomitrellae]GGI36512.1 Na(+)/H(+) antiporter NhaA 3 [Cnuibacter physcomitrellae]
MSVIRSERNAAVLLLLAAVLGLLLANTSAGPFLLDAKAAHLDLPALGIELSIGHWISDGLLAVFFLIVAIELKYELTEGSLDSFSKAVVPGIAAVGGIAVPALVFLGVVGTTGGFDDGLANGWPVPTATDIAFALGVLATFGRSLPSGVRVFLLALAVLDDLVAILIIALFFTSTIDLAALVGAVVGVIAFALLGVLLKRGRMRGPLILLMIAVGLLVWWAVLQSGVHATIAGVALGLVLPRRQGARTAHVLEPFSNGLVLPLFAFSAALVAIPQVSVGELSPAFWGILVALPVGKLLGISAAGWLGQRIVIRPSRGADVEDRLPLHDLLTVGLLGGIGFTVSLLMNELAFRDSPEVVDEGTLAVLLGSGISIVAAALVLAARSARSRRRAAAA